MKRYKIYSIRRFWVLSSLCSLYLSLLISLHIPCAGSHQYSNPFYSSFSKTPTRCVSPK